MEEPLFQIAAQGWNSNDELTFYPDRVEHTWKTSPLASGKSVYLRDSLSPYLSSQQTFGWGASSAFRSFGWYLGIGLILHLGFEKAPLQLAGILFYLLAFCSLIYGFARLKREHWLYIIRRDGGTIVTLRAGTIEGWTPEEFRERFENYVRTTAPPSGVIDPVSR